MTNQTTAMQNCANCGNVNPAGTHFCANCGTQAITAPQSRPPLGGAPPAQATPGWYSDPWAPNTQRYWDGNSWTSHNALQPVVAYVAPVQQKSVGIAILLTFLFPGLGHIYIGMNEKGMPFFIPNAVAFVLVLVVWIALPLIFVLWLVTFIICVLSISEDTDRVNAALAGGMRR
ncbi:MAG: DUF2510 domain-containing protein [Candidatus Nanopelagicales bacterium]